MAYAGGTRSVDASLPVKYYLGSKDNKDNGMSMRVGRRVACYIGGGDLREKLYPT